MAFAHRLIKGVRENGVECDLFSFGTRTSLMGVIREARRLRQISRDGGYVLVHAQYGTVTGFVTVWLQSRPAVVTYCGSDLNPCPTIPRLRWIFGHFLSQLAALRAAGIICVSRELAGRLWWRKNRARIITHGLDAALFQPGDRLAARVQLGLDPESRLVIFNEGAAPAGKGGKLVRAAMELVQRIVPDARLVVLSGDVPPVDVPNYLNAGDCLIFASDFEGSPNIVREALAVNLPVVSVDVGDVREHFSSIDGMTIVERTPEALGQAVVAVLTSGRRAHSSRFVLERFNTIANGRRIADLYAHVLGRDRAIENSETAPNPRALHLVPAASPPTARGQLERSASARETQRN